MLAKLTSKNQLTLPKTVVEQVRAEYYSVRTEGQSIVLTPVAIGGLYAVQEKLAALGLTERDVPPAIAWARKQTAVTTSAPASTKRKATASTAATAKRATTQKRTTKKA
jgi:hypothetical protein